MGYRDSKDSIIKCGDLVIVVYPYMDWDWARYKIGDLGMVMEVRNSFTYTIAKVKLFRTTMVESIPIHYIALLGDKNGSGRPSNTD